MQKGGRGPEVMAQVGFKPHIKKKKKDSVYNSVKTKKYSPKYFGKKNSWSLNLYMKSVAKLILCHILLIHCLAHH
jgi:hypothetical protein